MNMKLQILLTMTSYVNVIICTPIKPDGGVGGTTSSGIAMVHTPFCSQGASGFSSYTTELKILAIVLFCVLVTDCILLPINCTTYYKNKRKCT